MFTFFFWVVIAGHMTSGNTAIESKKLCNDAKVEFAEHFSAVNPTTGMPLGEHIRTWCMTSAVSQ